MLFGLRRESAESEVHLIDVLGVLTSVMGTEVRQRHLDFCYLLLMPGAGLAVAE